MLDKDKEFIYRQRIKALDRIHNSASKYVSMKKFNAAARAGLRQLIDEGVVEIIDAPFGKAYALKDRGEL